MEGFSSTTRNHMLPEDIAFYEVVPYLPLELAIQVLPPLEARREFMSRINTDEALRVANAYPQYMDLVVKSRDLVEILRRALILRLDRVVERAIIESGDPNLLPEITRELRIERIPHERFSTLLLNSDRLLEFYSPYLDTDRGVHIPLLSVILGEIYSRYGWDAVVSFIQRAKRYGVRLQPVDCSFLIGYRAREYFDDNPNRGRLCAAVNLALMANPEWRGDTPETVRFFQDNEKSIADILSIVNE